MQQDGAHTTQPPRQVVVGILRSLSGDYLVCQRRPDGCYPLKWEFPGGKVETGETLQEALIRELHEELSIAADIDELLWEENVSYQDARSFSLHFFQVQHWSGMIYPVGFADYRWVSVSELVELDLLEGSWGIRDLLCSRSMSNPNVNDYVYDRE